MQRTIKRMVATMLLGLSLTLGAVSTGQIPQLPLMQLSDPGGGIGTGGGV